MNNPICGQRYLWDNGDYSCVEESLNNCNAIVIAKIGLNSKNVGEMSIIWLETSKQIYLKNQDKPNASS